MFSDANLPEPLVIREIENPVNLVEIGEKDNIGFNPRYTSVRLLGKSRCAEVGGISASGC